MAKRKMRKNEYDNDDESEESSESVCETEIMKHRKKKRKVYVTESSDDSSPRQLKRKFEKTRSQGHENKKRKVHPGNNSDSSTEDSEDDVSGNNSENEYEESSEDSGNESNESSETEITNENIYACTNHSYNREIPQSSDKYKDKKPIIPHSSEGGKWYYKANACPYCDVIRQRLDRHLITMHGDKKTISKISSLPNRCSLRLKLFSLLTNIGNERFNKDEVRNPNKILLVKRRISVAVAKKIRYLKNRKQFKAMLLARDESNEEQSLQCKSSKKSSANKDSYPFRKRVNKKAKKQKKPKRYTPLRVICPICRAYFAANSYSKHFSKEHGEMTSKDTRTLINAARRELDEYHPKASVELIRYVLPYITDDEVGLMCRHDELAILYGNKYIEQYVGDDQAKLVKGHMRLMMRVLFEMKQIDTRITDLRSAIQPHLFDTFIIAAKKICKVDKKVLGVVYNAHTIRMLWNRIFDILDAEYSKLSSYKKRRRKRENLHSYKASFKNEYLSKIGSKAQRTHNIIRRKKATEEIVDVNDIKVLASYLDENIDESLRYLINDGFDNEHYFSLLNSVMTYCMLFNGRRPAEMDRAKISDFDNRVKSDPNDDYFKQLNDKQKEQHNKYEKMLCQGKKIDGLDSTVYITKKQVNALRILIKFRLEAGIDPENDYLFALPRVPYDERMRHASAYEVMKKMVRMCQSENVLRKPKLLRSTACRIQIATLFGAIGDQEKLNTITNQLAHTKNIHFNIYRKSIPKNDIDVTEFLEKRIQEKSKLEMEDDTLDHTIPNLSKQDCTSNFTSDVSEQNVSENKKKPKQSVKQNQLVYSASKKNFNVEKEKLRFKSKQQVPLNIVKHKQICSTSTLTTDKTDRNSETSISNTKGKMEKKKIKVKSNVLLKNPINLRVLKEINSGSRREPSAELKTDLPRYSKFDHSDNKRKVVLSEKKEVLTVEPEEENFNARKYILEKRSSRNQISNSLSTSEYEFNQNFETSFSNKENVVKDKSTRNIIDSENQRDYHRHQKLYQSVKQKQLIFHAAKKVSEIKPKEKVPPSKKIFEKSYNSVLTGDELSSSTDNSYTDSKTSLASKNRKLKINKKTKSDLKKDQRAKTKLIQPNEGKTESSSIRGRGNKWTDEQINAFQTAFAKSLRSAKYATASEIRAAMAAYPCLEEKGSGSIRTRFSNIYAKNKKKISQLLQ